MTHTSAHVDAGIHPVVYAGRFVDQVADADLPKDCIVLGEQDTLPYELAKVLNRANTLTLLDLFSFPLEAMTGDHWDVPVLVVLPSDFDAESLTTTFGSAVFERLTFFDRIVTSDSVLWEELRREYCWAESQRLPVTGNHPGEIATEVCALFEAEADNSRSDKALHRAQAAVLEPQFVAVQEKRDAKVPLDVLGVGAGVDRWAPSFDPTKTRFVGLDVDEGMVETARANLPDHHFDRLGSDLLFPYDDESFDLVFSVTAMHRYPTTDKRTLLYEMWRVARPGGRLLFLEDFVFARQTVGSAVHPISVTEFVDLILDATAGQIVSEHVESLRYPDEDLHRGGVLSLVRLGVPKAR